MSSKYSVTEETLRAHDAGGHAGGAGLEGAAVHSEGGATDRESGAVSAASIEEVNYLDFDELGEDDGGVDSAGGSIHSRCAQGAAWCRRFSYRCDTLFVPLPGSSSGCGGGCYKSWTTNSFCL